VVQFGPVCKFGWCEPLEARVWPVVVVVAPSLFDDVLGLDIAAEDGQASEGLDCPQQGKTGFLNLNQVERVLQ
jgi:hypothetical protein